MAKLYASESRTIVTPIAYPQPVVCIETLFTQLDNHFHAYHSVQSIYAQVASESLTFVDPKNVVLFNEYVRVLQRNLGVAPKTVCPLALESMHPVTVNAELSLEGFLKDMWGKIKMFFTKIADAVKAFMTKHFTRLGRLKNKLKNLQTVAGETTKNIGTPRLDEAPSGLKSKFKGFDDITEQAVRDSVKTAADIVGQIKTIADLTNSTAKDGMIDAAFIADVKKLREAALAANKQIQANKDQKKDLGVFKDRAARKELDKDNKSLAQTAKDATQNADKIDDTVADLGKEAGEGDDALEQKAVDNFKQYGEKVIQALSAFKGKKMVGGQTLSKAEMNNEAELVVEFETSDDEPEGVSLTSKEGVVALCKEAYELIDAAEKQSQIYAKTNDEIMKQLKAVDSLIIDIDRVDPQRYGKYRQVLDKKIRNRLTMVKIMFRSYNQINKNFFETVLDTGDAVVDYSVLSLKHFK